MSQALRKLTAIVAKSKTIVIFINQIRMQIGVMFGNPETTPAARRSNSIPRCVSIFVALLKLRKETKSWVGALG